MKKINIQSKPAPDSMTISIGPGQVLILETGGQKYSIVASKECEAAVKAVAERSVSKQEHSRFPEGSVLDVPIVSRKEMSGLPESRPLHPSLKEAKQIIAEMNAQHAKLVIDLKVALAANRDKGGTYKTFAKKMKVSEGRVYGLSTGDFKCVTPALQAALRRVKVDSPPAGSLLYDNPASAYRQMLRSMVS